ncbi:MAG: S41 family peptidase [Candidatus Moraniibacteriota bacterium]
MIEKKGKNKQENKPEELSGKDGFSKKNIQMKSNYNEKSNYLARKKKKSNLFWIVIAVLLAFYSGVAWGKKQISPEDNPLGSISSFVEELSNPKSLLKNTKDNTSEKVDFGIFWDAWRMVDKKYVDQEELDAQERVYGAIDGMLKATGDPYTNFMDPEETKSFNADMEGSFEGIGAEIGIREDTLTIIAPLDGMPADEAGLKAGDKIIEIDEESANDFTVEEAVKKIRGEKGTDVVLTIFREGETETRDIKITRGEIDLESVRYEKKEDDIAYIQIVSFSEDTAKEFNKEITKAIADGAKGVVLDLRNNPGGYLNVAVELSSKFIPRGETIVLEKKRNGKIDKFKAIGGANLSELPVAVLINEGSASASEILAGALRDQKDSKLIGKKSFGKGSVQQLEKLSDGSSLKITIAEWLTPNGDSINEEGLKPDIEVEITDEDIENQDDVQLNRALEEIKKNVE